MIKELYALAFTVRTCFTHKKGAGPLADKQAQIQRPWVQYQTGTLTDMQVGKTAQMFMNRIVIATNALRFPYQLECAQDLACVIDQRGGVMSCAGVREFRFAYPQFAGNVARVFARRRGFDLLILLPECGVILR